MEKIKEFFQKKGCKIAGWAMTLTGAATLIIGGTTPAEINDGVGLTAGILSAIGALVVFITGKVSKKE